MADWPAGDQTRWLSQRSMEPQAPHHCPSGTVCVEPSKAPGEGGGPQENAAVGDARLSRHGAPEDEAAQADADAAVWAAEPLAVEFIEDLGRLRRAAVHELIHEHVAVVGPALVAVVVMAPAVHGGVDPHRVEASAADEGEFLVHGEGIGAKAVEQHHGAAGGAGRFGHQGRGRAEQGRSHGVPCMASAAPQLPATWRGAASVSPLRHRRPPSRRPEPR
jgi:hypothetical protein